MWPPKAGHPREAAPYPPRSLVSGVPGKMIIRGMLGMFDFLLVRISKMPQHPHYQHFSRAFPPGDRPTAQAALPRPRAERAAEWDLGGATKLELP